jgi:hypothetical protein
MRRPPSRQPDLLADSRRLETGRRLSVDRATGEPGRAHLAGLKVLLAEMDAAGMSACGFDSVIDPPLLRGKVHRPWSVHYHNG